MAVCYSELRHYKLSEQLNLQLLKFAEDEEFLQSEIPTGTVSSNESWFW